MKTTTTLSRCLATATALILCSGCFTARVFDRSQILSLNGYGAAQASGTRAEFTGDYAIVDNHQRPFAVDAATSLGLLVNGYTLEPRRWASITVDADHFTARPAKGGKPALVIPVNELQGGYVRRLSKSRTGALMTALGLSSFGVGSTLFIEDVFTHLPPILGNGSGGGRDSALGEVGAGLAIGGLVLTVVGLVTLIAGLAAEDNLEHPVE